MCIHLSQLVASLPSHLYYREIHCTKLFVLVHLLLFHVPRMSLFCDVLLVTVGMGVSWYMIIRLGSEALLLAGILVTYGETKAFCKILVLFNLFVFLCFSECLED